MGEGIDDEERRPLVGLCHGELELKENLPPSVVKTCARSGVLKVSPFKLKSGWAVVKKQPKPKGERSKIKKRLYKSIFKRLRSLNMR